MAEQDLIPKLFAALVSTQGILQKLLADKVLPQPLEAEVQNALAVNNSIIEEGSEYKRDYLAEEDARANP